MASNCAELRQLGQETGAVTSPIPGHDQERFGLAPDRRCLDLVADITINLGDIFSRKAT